MPALFIIQAQLSPDPAFMARYKQYQAQVQPLMALHGGKVLAIGTPEEIRANKQVLDAYLGS